MGKNLKISDDAHKKLKIYCAESGLKINDFASKLIIEYMENINEQIKKNKR